VKDRVHFSNGEHIAAEVQKVAEARPGLETYSRPDGAIMVEIAPHCYLNAELLAFAGRGRVT
jgi:hypothetical protein